MNNEKEQIIDIKDFLVEILYRWKSIVAITLVISLFVTGLSLLRGRIDEGKFDVNEISVPDFETQKNLLIEEARGALTETEAQDVERIYRQYQSYIGYRNLYQEELENYNKAFDKTGEEMLIKCVSYRVSSSLEGVENQFTSSSMDVEDYRKIIALNPDVDSLSSAYKHVYIGAVAGNTTELTNLGETETVIPSQYIITVEILGETRDVCEKVWGVVDAAFKNKQKQLQGLDHDIVLELVSENYRGNIYEYYIAKEQGAIDAIQRVDSTIHNLKLYSIERLSEEQKTYFYALLDPERGMINQGIIAAGELSGEGEGVPASVPENKKISIKWIILGVIGGLFLSLVYILFRYLFSGTINIGQEIQDYYQVPVLNTFFANGRKEKGLFPGLIQKLLHMDSTEPETKAAMIAADAGSAVKATEGGTVYIVRTYADEEDVKIAAMIERAVSELESGYQAASGQPLASVEEMQSLTQQQAALLLVHNKKTLRADVEKLLDLCKRHSIKVLGAVAITDY